MKRNEIIEIITKIDVDLNKYHFRIPLYQRPYAWTEDNIFQLIEDLRKAKKNKYFLGNIVVYENGKKFDVIDGQQRLTAIYLMLKAANASKEPPFELSYEIREEDEKFLREWDGASFPDDYSVFYDSISTILKFRNELNEIISKIYMTITRIPEHIDVVRYFEAINNRGKQLEKHQTLKAKFLEVLKDDNEYDYARI